MIRRSVGLVAAMAAAATVLSACGSGAYCSSVEQHRDLLAGFGGERTHEAYQSYASAFREIAEVAPSGIDADYVTVAESIELVLETHDEAGVTLESMTEEPTVFGLAADEREAIEASYQSFNETSEVRRSIADDIEAECSITLTPTEGS